MQYCVLLTISMQIKLVWCAYKATSLSHVHTLQTSISFFKQSILRTFQIYLNTLWRTCVYVPTYATQARAHSVRSQHIRRGLIMKISVDFVFITLDSVVRWWALWSSMYGFKDTGWWIRLFDFESLRRKDILKWWQHTTYKKVFVMFYWILKTMHMLHGINELVG